MEYRKFGDTYYIRMDRGDKVVSAIREVCLSEGIKSAIYSGIGGCSSAQIQTFIPEKGEFETEEIHGDAGTYIIHGECCYRQRGQAPPAYTCHVRI